MAVYIKPKRGHNSHNNNITVVYNIVDTSYTRFIITEKEIYVTMLWTDYQTHQWALFPIIMSLV